MNRRDIPEKLGFTDDRRSDGSRRSCANFLLSIKGLDFLIFRENNDAKNM
jgi:hypothetical protein